MNDEPITHHEIDQRARLLSLSSRLGSRVKANFQALIKRKSTNARLRGILKETIEANPGKSRDQVLAIFEKRKQAYARTLQQQAVKSARAQMIPRFRQAAKKELIEERLKMQEAKRLKAVASQAAIDGTIGNIAKRNKVTAKQFLANIGRSGIGSATFKEKIKAQ
ncbi:MAG: SurA N-terminal domain-containing protein, partial [Pseudomonadota bacterium]